MPPKFDEQFVFDQSRNIWALPNFQGIGYSDGPESERFLDEIVKNTKDLSSTSFELELKAKDWPSIYHLSRNRSLLLHPFSWNKSWEVLELGGECGAITRFLGEKCKKVDMVEGSLQRAALARLRCKELSNVDIYAASFNTINYYDKKYDIVTLIGVLEYENLFKSDKQYLKICGNLLKNDGTLIIAIENKFGLKYFSGCSEDHTGIKFEGIEGYPPDPEKQPATYGLAEIKQLLKRFGFENASVYCPYPDYKIPSLIMSEKALQDANYNFGELTCHEKFFDYLGKRNFYFSDRLASYELGKNQALMFFAPSFLIFAGKKKIKREFKADWHAKLFSVKRAPKYQTTSTVFSSGKIEKQYFYQAIKEQRKIHNLVDSKWHSGQTLYLLMERALKRKEGVELFYQYLKMWHDYLLSKKLGDKLPSNAVDLTPWNLILTEKNILQEYDLEWDAKEAVPIEWTLYRGLHYFIIDHLGGKGGVLDFVGLFNLKTEPELIKFFMGKIGVRFNDEDLAHIISLESNFLAEAMGKADTPH